MVNIRRSIRSAAARGCPESALCEGAVIAQVAFENHEEAFLFGFRAAERRELDERAFERWPPAMLVASGAAPALALLPAAVGVVILLGTVPLEFGADSGLAIVVGIQLAAMAAGILAAIRAPRPSQTDLGFN